MVPGQKVPVIVQKSDGGFNYESTDIACIRYRIHELGAERIIYVTDSGQEFHFKQVFEASRLCGFYDPKHTQLDHMGFGLMLQESTDGTEEQKADGKKTYSKIKTREGKSVKLMELLNEARDRALMQIQSRLDLNDDMEYQEGEKEALAEIIGMSSVKYYELKQNRISDYVFSFDKILDPKGNTGVYLLYMYVRICSILRKGNVRTLFILMYVIIVRPRDAWRIGQRK